MKRFTLAVAVLGMVAGTALADWSDNFDSYSVGNLYGQGGWTAWDNVPGATGFVTNSLSLSPPNSQYTTAASDSVHMYSGYTSGTWEYKAMSYVPTDFVDGGTYPDSGSYFILLNTYNHGGPYNWSVQVHFRGSDNVFVRDGATITTAPLIRGQWVEVKATIDLTADTLQIYYGGNPVGSPQSWKNGVYGGGGGVANIAAVDLYANGSSPVYWDNMSLTPEPASLGLLALGLLLRRR